jgi:hypothetical protein
MEEQPYSPLFYVMLFFGLMGLIGFFMVAIGAGGGL